MINLQQARALLAAVLAQVYAKCVAGRDEVARHRIKTALELPDDQDDGPS